MKQIAQLLDKAVRTYSKYWMILLPFAFLESSANSLESIFQYIVPVNPDQPSIVLFLVSIIQFLLSAIFTVALFWQINALIHDGWASYRSAFDFGLKRAITVMVAFLTLGLLLIVFSVTLLGVAGLFGESVLGLVMLFGGLGVLFYLILRLSMLMPTVIFESKSILESFSYCLKITQSKKACLLILTVLTVAPLIAFALIAIPAFAALYTLPLAEFQQQLMTLGNNEQLIRAAMIEFQHAHFFLITGSYIILSSIMKPLIVISLVMTYRELQRWFENQRTGHAIINA